MKLPYGTLKAIQKETAISRPKLCDYAAARVRPGRKRALVLEKACAKVGLDVPAAIWLFGPSTEIRKRLSSFTPKPPIGRSGNQEIIKTAQNPITINSLEV